MNGLDFDTWEKNYINGYDKNLNNQFLNQYYVATSINECDTSCVKKKLRSVKKEKMDKH
jgi:hypothetical protein